MPLASKIGSFHPIIPHEDKDDPHFVIRRAILLRSMLERNAPRLLNDGRVQIDPGVLRAFLLTREYKHGARSMESLIAMSQLEGKIRFERSSLPTRVQMDLHVEGRNFMAEVQRLELSDEVVERMAEIAHEVYCKAQRDAGWKYGHQLDEKKKTTPSLAPYEKLPAHEKDQNRGQVRDIPSKLAYAGCYMVPARDGEPPFKFPPAMLEELASMEHTRWMRMKAHAHWRYGPKTDRSKLLHNCMLPWRKDELSAYADFVDALGIKELPEKEKEKDRVAVRDMATILNIAGYTIVEANI